MTRRRRGLGAVALALVVLAACGDGEVSDGGDGGRPGRPAVTDDVVVRGTARLDGEPFDARWIGAVVLRADGLATACQGELPPIEEGDFELTVLSEASSAGCGAAGASVVLWTSVGDGLVYSTNTLSWPASAFDPVFDSSQARGAAPELAQFSGGVYDEANDDPLPAGTVVEAYVADVLCGVASVRSGDGFTGYVLAVVGPESKPGCQRDAAIELRVGGVVATHAASLVNTPPGLRDTVDLVVRQ
jgi:hypothetical protein